MKIVLFRPFADPYRLSMSRYAAAVERRVGLWLGRNDRIVAEKLPDARLAGWARYWDQYVRYQRYARAHAGDVNHVVDHAYAHLARSLPANRTIVTFHDAVAAKVPGASWRTRLAFRYNLQALRRAAAVVCGSEAAMADLKALVSVPEDRLHVIPLGIDEPFRPAVDRAAVRRRLGFSGDVVLIVGHTQPYQNVERMIRAVGAVVQQHHLNVNVVKIGLPFTATQTRLITELDLNDRVQVVGRVPDDEMPAYYQAADVLFYAPLLAGFGLPPLEAMACGTPVVASNRGSIPEVVGNAAFCVDPEDENAMASALAVVLTEPIKRRRLIDAGFERASRYEWTESARRLFELYRTVAGG
jgi:glycosyltransferase involved in cell wall biosynthesis